MYVNLLFKDENKCFISLSNNWKNYKLTLPSKKIPVFYHRVTLFDQDQGITMIFMYGNMPWPLFICIWMLSLLGSVFPIYYKILTYFYPKWCVKNENQTKSRQGIEIRIRRERERERVVYFVQPLGAAHSKRCSKYAFSMFVCKKAKKEKKQPRHWGKFGKKSGFFKFPPEHRLSYLSQKIMFSVVKTSF